MRASLEAADVFPKTENGLRAGSGVGGTPESVMRAARYGYGLMLAIIGGSAARFRPFVDLFRRSLDTFDQRAAWSGCTRPATSPRPTSRRGTEVYEGLEAMNNTIGTRAGLAPVQPPPVSSTTSVRRARSTPVRRRRSPARSPTTGAHARRVARST